MQQEHADRDEDQAVAEAIAQQTDELSYEDNQLGHGASGPSYIYGTGPSYDQQQRNNAISYAVMSFGKQGASTDEALLNRADSIRNYIEGDRG